MLPIKWAPMDEASIRNDGNDMLSPLVADLQSDPVQPTKHLHLAYNLEDYKSDGMPEQE